MPGLKEHLPVPRHDDHRRGRHHQGFLALGFRRHRDLFLHDVDKHMEDDRCEHASVVFDIDPGLDKIKRDRTEQEIQHIVHIKKQVC